MPRTIPALVFVLIAIPAQAALRAAAAKVDITPTTHEIMWGFESRLAPAESTLDPLYARVLILEAGTQRLAIVALDLGRSFGEPALDRLRESAKKSSNISCLLVSASHTHSAPILKDEYSTPPAWEQRALERIEAAIAEAATHLEEARLGTGTGSVYIGHNRLPLRPDGTFGWFERNETMLPTAPVDPTVTVLRVDAANGTPLAILVNYACHPVVLGPDNRQYSADFPAAMNRTVEAALGGGRVISFFLQGAPGDINPYHAVTPLQEGAIKMRDWTGERLGVEAARVAKEIHTENVLAPSIDFREETLNFRLRWDQEKFQAGLLKFLGPKTLDLMGSPIRPVIQARVTAVLINREIAIATFPGEPFVDFQKNWRDRSPVPTNLLFGYTNGYHGYFPTISATARGGYGAGSASTWVEPGAGERIVDWAVIKTYEMLGKLTDLPDDLKRDVYK